MCGKEKREVVRAKKPEQKNINLKKPMFQKIST